MQKIYFLDLTFSKFYLSFIHGNVYFCRLERKETKDTANYFFGAGQELRLRTTAVITSSVKCISGYINMCIVIFI